MRYVLPVVLFLLQVAVPVSADDSMYINGSKWVSPSRDTNKDRTYTIHVFKGNVKVVDAPAKRPEWLPARIKKAFVRKVGIEKVNRI